MSKEFPYKCSNAVIAYKDELNYTWDVSVIKVNNRYYMFSSRWSKELGFGANWLFNSEIFLSSSDTPEGPYKFEKVILKRRGREFFDGMNTHNTCIKYYNGKFYLYYMGTTYDREPPVAGENVPDDDVQSTWTNKRIGLAISDKIDGDYIRQEKPLLQPREGLEFWDNRATTNPSVCIMPDGKTYMIYKSMDMNTGTLKLGISVAEKPEGPFRRLSENPIISFKNPNMFIEDPYLWYDLNKKKFCILAKDDVRNGDMGITGEWGAGFYAESDDCINFKLYNDKVYTKTITWKDGHTSTQCNLERVNLLFDEWGKPTHIFFASGDGDWAYSFKGMTYIICMELNKE